MAAHSADVPLRARLEEAAGDVVQGRQRCRAHHGERGGHSGRRSLGRWHRGQGQRDSRGGPRARTRVRTCARSRVRPRARPRALLRARTRARPPCGPRAPVRARSRAISHTKSVRDRTRKRTAISQRGRMRDCTRFRVRDRRAARGDPRATHLPAATHFVCHTFLCTPSTFFAVNKRLLFTCAHSHDDTQLFTCGLSPKA